MSGKVIDEVTLMLDDLAHLVRGLSAMSELSSEDDTVQGCKNDSASFCRLAEMKIGEIRGLLMPA